MKALSGRRKNRPFLGALTGTQAIEEYEFALDFNNGNVKSNIEFKFIDVPGELFDGNQGQDQIVDMAKCCQVLIVAIDTPAFIASSDTNYVIYRSIVTCETALSKLTNALGTDIKQVKGGKETPKLVVFVPIKCEKWVHDDQKKQDVMDKVDKCYRACIDAFTRSADRESAPRNNTKVMIMALETLGNVQLARTNNDPQVLVFASDKEEDLHKQIFGRDIKLYEEMRYIKGANRYIARCECMEAGASVQLFNGESYILKPGDKLAFVNQIAELHGYPYCYNTDCAIPYYWYGTDGAKGFSPKNCDQLFMEILKFMMQNVAIDSGQSIGNLLDPKLDIKTIIKIIIRQGMRFFGMKFTEDQIMALSRTLKKMKDDGQFSNDYKVMFNSLDDGNHLDMQL